MKTFVLLLSTLVIAGCDRAPAPPRPATATTHLRIKADHGTLRVKVDIVRDRTWVLGLNQLDVYDRRSGQLIRRIALPAWSVADFICEPDIAFDSSGTAFISHNLEPKLWQIDGDTFELKQLTIRLVDREQLDIGFGRLAFAPDGALFVVGSTGGSLWRIDLRNARAHEVKVDAPVLDECTSPYRGALVAATH
jgi:hypothetical protein